jgi:hypothetical protein
MKQNLLLTITFCFIGYLSFLDLCVPLSEAHYARRVDEGRCKPQDTDDDGADGHPHVEPGIYWESAHHSGCCHWSALVLHARRIPLLS